MSTPASRKAANQKIKANPNKGTVNAFSGKPVSSTFAGPSLPGKVSPGYYDPYKKVATPPSPSKSSNKSSSSKKSTSSKVKQVVSDVGSSFGKMFSGQESSNVNLTDTQRTANQRTLAAGATGAGRASANEGQTLSHYDPSWIEQILTGARNRWSQFTDNWGNEQNAAERLNESLGISPGRLEERETETTNKTQELVNMGFDPETANVIATGGDTNAIVTSYNRNQQPSGNRSRTSSPVSKPTPTYTPPTVFPNLPNPYQGRQDSEPMQSERGTVQRQWGSGAMSSGQFANGKGGYGFQGVFGGSPVGGNPDEQAILDMLGLSTPTAFAQEMPQVNQSFVQPDYYSGASSDEEVMQMLQGGWGGEEKVRTGGNDEVVNKSVNQVSQPQVQNAGSVGDIQKFSTKGYDKQIKAQKKALEELIKSIKKEYEQSQLTGTTQLEKAKQQDLMKLSGLYNFGLNQDPNSEDRIHAQERMGTDYAGQLTDFLSKLAQGQSKDIAGAKTNYSSTIADIIAQMEKAKQDYEEKMWDRNYKMATLNKKSGGPKSYGTALDKIMATRGVDIATARKIYNKENQLGGGGAQELKQDENGNWYYEE